MNLLKKMNISNVSSMPEGLLDRLSDSDVPTSIPSRPIIIGATNTPNHHPNHLPKHEQQHLLEPCIHQLLTHLSPYLGRNRTHKTKFQISSSFCVMTLATDLRATPAIQTPHLNQLAANGIRFTDCYLCSTGLFPISSRITHGSFPTERVSMIDPRAAGKPVPKQAPPRSYVNSEKTIAQHLKPAGYETCQVGKWHCNSAFNQPQQPQPG